MRILFICTGNTCRSPMAEAMFRHKVRESNVLVQSAGIAAAEGSTASAHARQVLADRGIAHDHRSQRLRDELVHWADVILTMTSAHKEAIHEWFPHASAKTFTLKEYVGYKDHQDIADPYGGSLMIYEHSAREINEALELLQEKVTK